MPDLAEEDPHFLGGFAEWDDYEDMLEKVNGVEYGLTAAIVTNDLAKAMETAERVEAGYVWINSSRPLYWRALWRLEAERNR
jgi:acyl-CoA reductase-like NAD-dependent aldehyde dehydrogenase